jgi:ATP-dependent Clp protease ATP-binding subunit ClpA
MTTNAGAQEMSKSAIGFGRDKREGEDQEAINRMFTPEFRNRLDAIVPFAYLGTEVVSRVVDKFILQLELQLADQNVHIQFDSDARGWLGERGYDKLYGARPMARLIQEKVKQPLAEELLFGKLAHGGEVHVTTKDGDTGKPELSFELTPAPPKLVKKAAKATPKRKPKAQPETSEEE